jgi:protein-disulfide isomerase
MRLPVVFAFLTALTIVPVPAQAPTWENATQLDGVDMSGLSAAQQKLVLEITRSEGCTCGCGMKVAECRVKDPACSYSKGMAAMVVKGVKEGKPAAEVRGILAKLPRREPPKILEDPVQISITGAPAKGAQNPKLTIVEFSDFQCPYCSVAVLQADAVLKMYPNDVRLVFKQFPLDELHPQARFAAEASLAAHAQGKFWEMHDKLFANGRRLSRESIVALAASIGLDMKRFTADLDSGKYKKAVQDDLAEGVSIGIQGTPSFYLNGRKYNGPFDTGTLKPLIDQELKAASGPRKAAD